MSRVHVDVREVEPKDRYDRIMGAYNRLSEGEILDLVVDHDPRCMYYTLKATRGDAAFTFTYVESGPETWRVEVRRTAGTRAAHSAGAP